MGILSDIRDVFRKLGAGGEKGAELDDQIPVEVGTAIKETRGAHTEALAGQTLPDLSLLEDETKTFLLAVVARLEELRNEGDKIKSYLQHNYDVYAWLIETNQSFLNRPQLPSAGDVAMALDRFLRDRAEEQKIPEIKGILEEEADKILTQSREQAERIRRERSKGEVDNEVDKTEIQRKLKHYVEVKGIIEVLLTLNTNEQLQYLAQLRA